MERDPEDLAATPANRKCSAITGSARKIKDNAADWHNLTLRWEKLNDHGFNVAANVVNIRRSQDASKLLAEEEESLSSSSTSAPTAGATELQEECCKLQAVVDKMAALVKKMEHLVTSQRGIQDLEAFQFGPKGRASPLFHTWKTQQFEGSGGVLLEAFSQELRLKRTLLREVAHTAEPDLALVLLSCWLHQPYMPPQCRLGLEALLLETGHRPL